MSDGSTSRNRAGKAGSAAPGPEAPAPVEDWDRIIGVPLAVRVSPRARRVGLRIDDARRSVLLVLPTAVPMRQGLRFLATQRGWVMAQLAALPQQKRFTEEAIVPILGVPHRIRREFDAAAPAIAIGGGEIRVRGDPAHLSRRVRDRLIAAARSELGRRARAFAARIERRVKRVAIRDPVSRWGSCSASGSLSFSWRLILAPEAVGDYVVAHEVAHLVEMNHGPGFWRLVESLVPGSNAPRAWLKRHRSQLMSYG